MLEQSADTAPTQGIAATPEMPVATPPRHPDAGDLSGYARSARRSLRGALVGAVLGLLVAVALLLSPASYTATSTVRIYPITSEPFDNTRSASGLIDPATEAAVAQSDAVLELAATKYDAGVTAARLRQSVDVTPIEASTVLNIDVTAGSSAAAQREADAVAKAYLDYRESSGNARQDDLVAQLKNSIAAVDAERVAAGDRFKASPKGSVTRQQALADHSAALAERDSLQAQLDSLEQAAATGGGEVLRSATSVAPTVSPDRRLVLTSGVVGGAVLGFLAAFSLGQFGGRVRRLADLEKVSALWFSAEVDGSRRGKRESNVEVFRALREQRKIDGWPETPYSTVFALDLRSRPGLDTALAVAQSLAQEHGSATVLALGWDGEVQEDQLDALGFRPVSNGWITTEDPPVGLRTFERDDSLQVADAYFTNSASAALESMNSTARPIVVWCPGSCGESTRLALLSRSDTLLLTVESKRGRLADVRHCTTEAVDAGVAWVGALLVR